MECKNCGAHIENVDIAAFCGTCGSKVEREDSAAVATQNAEGFDNQSSQNNQNGGSDNNIIIGAPNSQNNQHYNPQDPFSQGNNAGNNWHGGQQNPYQQHFNQYHAHLPPHLQSGAPVPQGPAAPAWFSAIIVVLPILSWLLNIISVTLFSLEVGTYASRMILDFVSAAIAITALVLIVMFMKKYPTQRRGCFLAIAIVALIGALANGFSELAMM